MPGLKYQPGEIPEEWHTWFIDNLKRGVDAHKLLKGLATKGFQAAKNQAIMHRVMAFQSFKFLTSEFPDLYPDVDHMNPNASASNPACLPEEWHQVSKRARPKTKKTRSFTDSNKNSFLVAGRTSAGRSGRDSTAGSSPRQWSRARSRNAEE